MGSTSFDVIIINPFDFIYHYIILWKLSHLTHFNSGDFNVICRNQSIQTTDADKVKEENL